MKGGSFYSSSVAVTRNSLVATSCTCKAGSHGLERGVCVHNLPLILQLVLLLVDGLANHILVELCQRWTSHLESKLDGLGKLEVTKKAILTLMKANGSEHTSSLFHLSINDILKISLMLAQKSQKRSMILVSQERRILFLYVCMIFHQTAKEHKKN